jgi:hypothetical protein
MPGVGGCAGARRHGDALRGRLPLGRARQPRSDEFRQIAEGPGRRSDRGGCPGQPAATGGPGLPPPAGGAEVGQGARARPETAAARRQAKARALLVVEAGPGAGVLVVERHLRGDDQEGQEKDQGAAETEATEGRSNESTGPSVAPTPWRPPHPPRGWPRYDDRGSRSQGDSMATGVSPPPRRTARRLARRLPMSPWAGASNHTRPKRPVATSTIVPPAATFR